MVYVLKSTGDEILVTSAFNIGEDWFKILENYLAKQLTISFSPIKSNYQVT